MQVKGHLNQEWGINHLMKLVFVLSTAAITKVDDFCKLKAPFQQVFCHFGLKMLNSMVVMLYVIRNKKKRTSPSVIHHCLGSERLPQSDVQLSAVWSSGLLGLRFGNGRWNFHPNPLPSKATLLSNALTNTDIGILPVLPLGICNMTSIGLEVCLKHPLLHQNPLA